MKASKQAGTKSSVPSLSLIRFRILRRPPARITFPEAILAKKENPNSPLLNYPGGNSKSQKPQYRNRNSNVYYIKNRGSNRIVVDDSVPRSYLCHFFTRLKITARCFNVGHLRRRRTRKLVWRSSKESLFTESRLLSPFDRRIVELRAFVAENVSPGDEQRLCSTTVRRLLFLYGFDMLLPVRPGRTKWKHFSAE